MHVHGLGCGLDFLKNAEGPLHEQSFSRIDDASLKKEIKTCPCYFGETDVGFDDMMRSKYSTSQKVWTLLIKWMSLFFTA